ncbi:response regulator [Anaerobacillus sp. CMMVII]|uniref:response regulator n=1 Tax=Anaerobacillus sp. CMMVII TaxID=2755588 RepID=UPI0021B7EFB8|nr:response regulator [Anaerobacillus sp. CMMVII]MCT8139157.1 response regulator [Anaerobacillus sp. CMMVII]
MYVKLLIVDDEQIEREGMEAILQKAFANVEIKQAKNGRLAVEMAGEFQPDLILMDIKMPGMTGLEAIQLIREQFTQIKFIMVTAFDTFEFARQAIKLGVKDYLLKPSKATEIVDTVGRVLKEIEAEQHAFVLQNVQQNALKKTLSVVETDVVTQLLFDHVHEIHLDMLVEMLEIPMTKEMFVIIVLLPTGSEKNYREIKNIVRDTRTGWVGPMYGNQLPIIVFRDFKKSFRSQAINLARQILSSAKFDIGAEGFIGIGSVCSALDQLKQSYQDALIATMDTTMSSRYRFYSDIALQDELYNEYFVKHRQKEFSDHIRIGHWNQVRLDVINLIQYSESEGKDLVQTQQQVLEALWIASRVLNELGIEIEIPLYFSKVNDYRQLRFEAGKLLDQMIKAYLDHYDRIEADTIHQIKQYIFDHSNQEISLEALGRKVGLSPIYISKMFKEKLGINYIDFLTECRIEKAKRLMSDPQKSIKEITFEVGYHEPNYFSKVFKKMCHVSPKEYRKTLLGKKDEWVTRDLKK